MWRRQLLAGMATAPLGCKSAKAADAQGGLRWFEA
jgi:hypothetical protein